MAKCVSFWLEKKEDEEIDSYCSYWGYFGKISGDTSSILFRFSDGSRNNNSRDKLRRLELKVGTKGPLETGPEAGVEGEGLKMAGNWIILSYFSIKLKRVLIKL